jgi:hypothetical protein
MTLSLRGLARGRYSVLVEAVDVAENRSPARRLTLTVV